MSEKIQLQLGDIIEITAPENEVLNNNIFLIDYIDNDKIKLIDVNLSLPVTLVIEDSELKDKTIESISLLSRSDEEGYARQNALVPNTWVDVFFSGDVPQVVTGQITNLEEDMIELRVFPGDDAIYIDFAYKGMPENIPIEKIIIRDVPTIVKEQPEETPITDETPSEEDVDPSLVEAEPTVVERMKEIFINADEINLGDDLEQITQLVHVKEGEERYGLDNQTNDLLDDLLSTIPTINRTPVVISKLEIMIQRFVELRTKFSTFDEYGNAIMPEIKTASYKPLVESIKKLNTKLDWLLPVTQTKKNVYDIDQDIDDEYSDINSLTTANSRIMDTEELNQFYSGERDYNYLLSVIQKQGTPFADNSDDPNVIRTQQVNTTINGIVNNLDDFYSTVVKDDILKRKRFFLQTYGKSPTHLVPTEDKNIYLRKPLQNNDTINISSLLMLPEPFVNYNRIHLPTTNILDKTQLNKVDIRTFKMFNSETEVNSYMVGKNEFKYDDNQFLALVNEFTIEDGVTYDELLNNIIPRTRQIFELMKKYIGGKYNLINLVQDLEPFLVYLDDLTYKQYQVMVTYINKQITEYKKRLVTKTREFQQLQYRKEKASKVLHSLFNLLKQHRNPKNDEDLQEYVMKTIYDVDTKSIKIQRDESELVPFDSASEILSSILSLDNANLLNTAIASANISLITPIDIQAELEKNNQDMLETIQTEKQKNSCKEFILTKKYLALDELEDDNKKQIYFDKNLDPTHYDILEGYRQEESTMSQPDFKQFLIEKLIQNIGLTETAAEEDAIAMVEGKREVREGQYAVLDILDKEPVYFKRIDGEWEQDDKNDAENINVSTQKMFCDLQTNCLQPEKTNICQDNSLNESILKQKNLEQLLKEFDLRYESSKEELTKWVGNEVTYLGFVGQRLREIQENSRFKNNDIKISIGLSLNEEGEPLVSPHLKLLNMILGQSDFPKKQGDIIQFAYKFTRDANKDENQYWKYCLETNTKLLPMFLFKLASVFISGGNYLYEVEQICTEQGKLSDDGDAWVDQHSGFTIRKIDYSNEEGFDESGYKIVSTEIMEQEIMIQGETKIKYEDPNSKIVEKIVSAITRYIGIDLSEKMEFIVRNVILINEKAIPPKDIYEEKAAQMLKAKNKKLPLYEDALNSSLMLLTLTFIHLAIQISIPAIKTKKTFPGCVRSFSGFPLDGSSSYEGIIYIACVANKLKAKTAPWNSLTRMNEKGITKRIVDLMNKYAILDPQIRQAIQDKRQFILLNKDDEIPIEHDIRKWKTLLPPLIPIKLDRVDNITPGFRESLLKHLKKGNYKQHEQLLIIESKMIQFGMSIIENMQKITTKVSPLLTNAANEPFLENACCHDDDKRSTYDYFVALNPTIEEHNNFIEYLYNIIQDMTDITRPVILFDPNNTKISFPPLTQEFTEETIYKTFIKYCKFDLKIKLPPDLERLCGEVPDSYDQFDPIKTTIEKFKRAGKHFTPEMMERLLSTIASKNQLKLNINPEVLSNTQQIRVIIELLEQEDDTSIPPPLRAKILGILDTYDISLKEDTMEIRDLKNYLGKRNQEMKDTILSFVRKNSKLTPRKLNPFVEFMTNFSLFSTSETQKEEDDYQTIQNIRTFLNDFLHTFPNIVINEVDYDEMKIPRHWKLTERHNLDVKRIIISYYSPLLKSYGNEKLKTILRGLGQNTRNIIGFIDVIPCFRDLEIKDKLVYSIFSTRVVLPLCEFLFLSSILELIELSDQTIIEIKNKPEQISDLQDWSQVGEIEPQSEELTAVEIVEGDIKEQNEKTSLYLIDCISILNENYKINSLSYDEIMRRVNRAKEMEKDQVTKRLKDMTDEQREINTLFKSYKLEEWGVGLQKGLTQYVGETYDQEREAIERRAILELQVGKQSFVTDMNREIFMMDLETSTQISAEIDREVNDLSALPEDDDFGEGDGDFY